MKSNKLNSTYESDIIVVKSNPETSLRLCHKRGTGNYFFIKGWNHSLTPMLHMPRGMKFFAARALAVRLYDAFVSGIHEFNYPRR